MTAQLGALVDQFAGTALNSAVWNQSSAGAVGIDAPGRAYVTVSAAYPALGSGPWDGTGQAVYAKVTPAPAGAGGAGVQTLFKVQLDGNNSAYLVVRPGVSFQAFVYNAGTASAVNLPAYDPTAHAWWRIRETGGSFVFEAGPDGAAWSTLATLAHTWPVTAVSFFYIAGTFDGTLGGAAYLEHLNTPLGAAGTLPAWPRISFGVAFNVGGTQSGTPYWTDLTARLRDSWTATQAGRQYELDAVQSGTATVTLDTTDGALDPTNPAGPYYGMIRPFRRARLAATWPPSRNWLPQGLANGTSTADTQLTGGSRTVATAAPAPTGHTRAVAWSYPVFSGSVSCGLGATTAAFTSCDQDAVPVLGQPGQAPGQQWTFSVYASIATGGPAGLQLSGRISWYRQDGTRITPSDSAPVTLPTAPGWTRITVTAAAPAGAVWARVSLISPATTVTTVAGTVYLTGWQFEQSATVSPWTDPGGTFALWGGYVERWRQRWPKGVAYGTVEVGCVDALAGIARLTLQPSLQQTLAALGPSMMYAFNEPAGATQFADATGRRTARLPLAAPSGAGSATITSGTTVQGAGSVGNAGPVVTITNPNPGQIVSQAGMYIGPPPSGPFGPPATGGWTRIICFRTTVTPSNRMALWTSFAPGAAGGTGSKAYIELFIDSSGHFNAALSNADGSATSSFGVSDVFCPNGAWHIGIVQLSSDGKTFTVACDNFGYQDSTTGDFHPTGCTTESIGGLVIGSASYLLYSGDLAYAVEIPYEINNDRAFDIGVGFSLGWSGDTSTQRAQRILTMAGYPGQLASLDGVEVMGPANLAGQNAGAALQVVADSEAGQVYADPSGVVTLAGRRWRYLQATPAVVFGDGPGEVPYLGDVSVDLDPDHVYNTVQVTNQVGAGAEQPPDTFASNSVSAGEYFPSSLARTINVQDQGEPLYAAQYLAGQYAEPQPRVSRVTVDPSSNPGLWPALLGLSFGTRARLNRRPNASPNAIQLDTYVEQLEWKGDDQGQLQLSLQQSAAAPYSGWLIAAALHTTLAAPATAGASTVTLAALTGSAANSAASVLPGGTVLTVGYGTAGAETVTVAPGGVATTTPGYTSVAVTLTAPLARSHVAGEAVCQPLPAGVTLPGTAAYPASLDPAATLTATGGPRAAY
ncbi:hypothetical protein CFP65_3300 [Kitasatospora sp. MMS16-BH015]|uniref:hypothetical protein n=1 Tax=Kitasatospora sp. MMS16-BH015 TaxID=2018025 RepID=UPI000CA3E27C|nr:hypothetical protein [Kitasatospora sp. MMS16-BH015]AUG78100.1 hypothetical protein CFP65_3300 [Kitasatospora sp. MMS16-BH015]